VLKKKKKNGLRRILASFAGMALDRADAKGRSHGEARAFPGETKSVEDGKTYRINDKMDILSLPKRNLLCQVWGSRTHAA